MCNAECKVRNARAEWCVECGKLVIKAFSIAYFLLLLPEYSILMYAAPALHVNVKQINELNVCWNMVFFAGYFNTIIII